MANGPVSYNHKKLNKPIDYYPDYIQLIGVYEDATLSPSATRECNGCVPPIAFLVSRTLFAAVHQTSDGTRAYPPHPNTSQKKKSWRATERTNNNDLSELCNPNLKLAVYLSGAGGKASMMKYKDQWWIVFGSDKKKNVKRITLHVPTVEFNADMLNKAVNDFYAYVGGWINEAV